jgi:hypothetical protein
MKTKSQPASDTPILDAMEERIKAAILASGQDEVLVVYSAYESDDDGDDAVRDNLDDVAIKAKKAVLIGRRDEFWGGEASRDYRSKAMTNPTWLDVVVCANAMIGVTGDEHHSFLEGVEWVGREQYGLQVYELLMGS